MKTENRLRNKVESYKDKQTFDEIQALKKKIYKTCVGVSRFKQIDAFFLKWNKFFSGGKYCKKTDAILDFGCASGFSIFAAKRLGFENVYGIDVKNSFYESIVKHVVKIIGVEDSVVFYKGYGTLPFETNYFDMILGFDAITKGAYNSEEQRKERLNFRVEELVRISKKGAKWYIRPNKHLVAIKDIYNKLNSDKNIEFNKLKFNK